MAALNGWKKRRGRRMKIKDDLQFNFMGYIIIKQHGYYLCTERVCLCNVDRFADSDDKNIPGFSVRELHSFTVFYRALLHYDVRNKIPAIRIISAVHW